MRIGQGTVRVGMEEIPLERAMEIAREKGLRPARVRGTDIVQFTRESASTPRIEILAWDELEDALEERGLSVFESAGWMKVMKRGKER